MRNECLDSKYAYDRRLPISRLVAAVGDSIFFAYNLFSKIDKLWTRGNVQPKSDLIVFTFNFFIMI